MWSVRALQNREGLSIIRSLPCRAHRVTARVCHAERAPARGRVCRRSPVARQCDRLIQHRSVLPSRAPAGRRPSRWWRAAVLRAAARAASSVRIRVAPRWRISRADDVTAFGPFRRRRLEHVDEKRGVAIGSGGFGARGGLGTARTHHTDSGAHSPREQRQDQQCRGCRRDSMSADELADPIRRRGRRRLDRLRGAGTAGGLRARSAADA